MSKMPFFSIITASFNSEKTIKDHGVRVSSYKVGAHCGTHLDSPSHFFEKGPLLGDIPLTTLIGPCYVIDFSQKVFSDNLIKKKDHPKRRQHRNKHQKIADIGLWFLIIISP